MSNVAYDPGWPVVFENLKTLYARTLSNFRAIEHVGSTSIPGASAKPRIDIDIVIESETDLPQTVAELERLGYYPQGNLGRPGREAFGRTDDRVPYDGKETKWMKHNLYVCTKDSPTLSEHIRFREYLRAHPEVVAEYCALKMRLAADYRHDQDAYVAGKSAFVRRVLQVA